MIKIIKKAGNFFIIPPLCGCVYNFPGLFNQNVKKSRQKSLYIKASDEVELQNFVGINLIQYIIIFLIFDLHRQFFYLYHSILHWCNFRRLSYPAFLCVILVPMLHDTVAVSMTQ